MAGVYDNTIGRLRVPNQMMTAAIDQALGEEGALQATPADSAARGAARAGMGSATGRMGAMQHPMVMGAPTAGAPSGSPAMAAASRVTPLPQTTELSIDQMVNLIQKNPGAFRSTLLKSPELQAQVRALNAQLGGGGR